MIACTDELDGPASQASSSRRSVPADSLTVAPSDLPERRLWTPEPKSTTNAFSLVLEIVARQKSEQFRILGLVIFALFGRARRCNLIQADVVLS